MGPYTITVTPRDPGEFQVVRVVASRKEASDYVYERLIAGHVGSTAEAVNGDGDVEGYYEAGRWTWQDES